MSELPGELPGEFGAESPSEGSATSPALTLPYGYIKEVADGGSTAGDLGLTRRYGGGKTSESLIVEALGDTILATPAGIKRLTLFWIALETSETNASEVVAKINIGEQTPYTWFLGAPGAFMHWEPIVGGPGDTLVLNLSVAVKVAVNFTYSEGS